jgi:hypothetical protein
VGTQSSEDINIMSGIDDIFKRIKKAEEDRIRSIRNRLNDEPVRWSFKTRNSDGSYTTWTEKPSITIDVLDILMDRLERDKELEE